jgi:uncharacterized protein (DUF2344 family)
LARNTRTAKAAEYIQENFYGSDPQELIKEAAKKFDLKVTSVRVIYSENAHLNMRVAAEENVAERESKKGQKETLFKGRKREKIQIDDSKLFAWG